MWTKTTSYRSFFMLVRVRIGAGFLFSIPIPLFLLDQTLDVVEDLAWLAEKFVLPGVAHSSYQHDSDLKRFRSWTQVAGSPRRAVKLCREIIDELRRYGKWRMVEVEARDPEKDEQVRVYVDFM